MTKVSILAMSDTHNHSIKDIVGDVKADIFLHCGDWTMTGNFKEISNMRDYIKEVRGQCGQFIWCLGNHDMEFEEYRNLAKEIADETNTLYLNDAGAEVNGIKFWGSNYVPQIGSWAFMYSRPTSRWDMIPDDTEFLFTHGVPKGILDGVPAWRGGLEHVGCQDLTNRILQLKKLKTYCGGHIHEGREVNNGVWKEDRITFYNCSIMNGMYYPLNKPHLITLER